MAVGSAQVPGKIFVNYRRSDEAGYAQALYQQLERAFGRERLFMDVEGYIKAGDDFVLVLQKHVAECDILLAVVGPRWIDAHDEQGERRLDNPSDFVRIEIVSAFDQQKRVIPVLVNNAAMVRANDLPEPLHALTTKNAVSLRPDRFFADCQGLIKDIRDELDGGTVPGPDKPKPSFLGFSAVFALAGLSAWITATLFRDADVSRPIVVVFSLVSLLLFLLGFVGVRLELKRRANR
jgi:TIR domain-containing protein